MSTQLHLSSRLLPLALSAAALLAASSWAAFVVNPKEAVRAPTWQSAAKAYQLPAAPGFSLSGSGCCSLCGLAAAAALAVKASHKEKSRTSIRASKKRDPKFMEKLLKPPDQNDMKNLLKPRFGKALARDVPANAERIGTIGIEYEVTLKKPFGLSLADHPDGAGFGVGVAEVVEGGSVAALLQEVIDGKDSMWVQEGDELQFVNGKPTNGWQDTALQLIAEAGDEVNLTFFRKEKGPIKVVFPDGKSITAPRTALLSRLAEKAGYDSGCTCSDGKDEKCWYKDPLTGEVYVLPLNCPGLIPSVWRTANETNARDDQMAYECWIPLRLVPAPEEFEKAMKAVAEADAKRAQEEANKRYTGF